MVYPQPVQEARFLSRPNRFIALCDVDGRVCRCHVKNTGRCRELLVPGAPVFLTCHSDPARSTAYSLIAVQKGEVLLNMDSQAPNEAAFEALQSGRLLGRIPAFCRREVRYRDARFDLYAEAAGEKWFIEVKGVTLEEGGHARFPDAPTLRGVKHMEHLIQAAEEGYRTMILFVLQFSPALSLSPNDETHPAFGASLRRAAEAGVMIKAVDCLVTPDSMTIREEVPICLNP